MNCNTAQQLIEKFEPAYLAVIPGIIIGITATIAIWFIARIIYKHHG